MIKSIALAIFLVQIIWFYKGNDTEPLATSISNGPITNNELSQICRTAISSLSPWERRFLTENNKTTVVAESCNILVSARGLDALLLRMRLSAWFHRVVLSATPKILPRTG